VDITVQQIRELDSLRQLVSTTIEVIEHNQYLVNDSFHPVNLCPIGQALNKRRLKAN